MDDLPPPPEGVTLRDPEDTNATRHAIFDQVMDATKRYMHGYEYGGVRMELADLHYADKDDYSLAEQKEALMGDKTLSRRLRGTVNLIDTETGKVIDTKKRITLARVPFLTGRGTFIHNGSEYSPIMQSRLLPGAYTRRRDNGEIETHLNVRPGTGSAMRVMMDPNTAVFRLKVGSSNVHAYSLFKDLGVSDEELERRWGKEILEINRQGYDKRASERVYNKVVPKWERKPDIRPEDRVIAIRDALQRAQASETILRANLPHLFSSEKLASLRARSHAVGEAERMVKEACAKGEFTPDLTPDQVIDSFLEDDYEFHEAFDKAASFDPDLSPGDMRESYNSIYGHASPQLASMSQWPEHWLDDQDQQGWLQWFENYHAGRRGPTDDHQIKRWNSFRARHGAQFVKNPTPRRAYALRNWAIDPVKLLPEARQDDFRKEMESYRAQKYANWLVRRHDFDEGKKDALMSLAKSRGAGENPHVDPRRAINYYVQRGFLKAEDLQ